MRTEVLKKLLLTFTALLMTTLSYSQATYLKITKSDKAFDYEMYPPRTKFELKNKKGDIVFKSNGEPDVFEIKEKHTLYVYPSWKNDPDIYILTEGKVEKLPTHKNSNSKSSKTSLEYNGVSADSKLIDSNTFDGKKNLEFNLSNGIQFVYLDGNYSATLNDKPLKIKGKYLIYSEIGILKLSFNPNNGKVWWVFEPSK